MSRRSYSLACLAGHGVGPEVMAAASRAVDAASALHGFRVEEQHVPFGADALMRFGNPFPLASRRAVLAADAVLVASGDDDLLAALQAELDLRASVVRLRFESRFELTLFSPHGAAWSWTLDRAVEAARASRGRLTLAGVDARWAVEAAAVADDHAGLEIELLEAEHAMRALVVAPSRFDVVVVPPELLATATEIAGCLHPGRFAIAWGRLAENGPGVFGSDHGAVEELAGQGVADPRSLLLAAALLLGEGLAERSAAGTLSGAVGRADADRVNLLSDSLADVVVAQLPLTLSNHELANHEAEWEAV